MEFSNLTGALDINVRKFIDDAKLVEEDGKKFINIRFNKNIKEEEKISYLLRLNIVFKKWISEDEELYEFKGTKIRSV